MAVTPKPLMETILGEAIRNWVVDTVVDHTMPMLKYVDNDDPNVLRYTDSEGKTIRFLDRDNQREIRLEYMEAIYWLRNKPQETRAIIISAGQGLYSVLGRIPLEKIIPLAKFPILESILDFTFEQTGETLEQLPDSLRAYAGHEDHLPFPEEFKPRDMKEVLTALVGSIKDAIVSSVENIGEVLKGRIPALEGFLAPIMKLMPKFGGQKEESMAGYNDFAAKHPDKVPDFLKRVGEIPHDAQDDWQRIIPGLSPDMIKSLIELPLDEMVKAIRAMAKDTVVEQIEAAASGTAGLLNDTLDEVNKLINRRRDKRAEKRAARLSRSGMASVRLVPSAEDAIDVEVQTLTPEQRRAIDPGSL